MMNDLLERLFDDALDVPKERRAAWLERACGGDVELHRRLRTLLAAHEANAADDRVAPLPVQLPTEETPESIGEYEVLGAIGEGGIGAVFDTRHRSTGRRAAVKLIRTGFATSKQRLRFQLEAEILGKLNHPNIAHLYEAGVAEVGYGSGGSGGVGNGGGASGGGASGGGVNGGGQVRTRRPFIAMEFVAGRSIFAWAEGRSLGIRQRVMLLAKAAHAVEHAHQRGVIHRDLKPANIMVTDDGAVKVVDFGIAKLLERAAPGVDGEGGVTHLTVAGAAAGTPAFMSPEQLLGRSDQVDLMTDVYGLGATLYYLLTGAPPLTATELLSPVAAASMLVRETVSIRKRNDEVDPDLAAVVHKAIEREPGRRYESAAQFVADLERWLSDRPTIARPLGTFGRVVRYTRRNKWKSVAMALLMMGALGGVGLLALVARSGAREHAALAEQQAALAFMNDMLVRVSPESSDGFESDGHLSDLVRQAEKEIQSSRLSPRAKASVRLTLARINLGLGKVDAAKANAEAGVMLLESLGERGQPRIEAIELLALIERETNDLRRVADLRYEAWQWRLKNRGESDPETLRAAVEVCVIEMETIYPHGPNIPDALTTIGKLKALKLRRGETWGRQDEMALVRSLELAAHHYIVLLDDLVTLGTLLDEAIDASTATQGPNHPGTVRLIRLKGLAMLKTGEIERARPLLEEVRERLIERLGKEHLTVLNVEVLLAGAEAQSGRADEALEELGRIEPMLVERVGRDHFRVVSLRLDMARTLRLLGRLDEAHGLIAACHDSLGRMQGPTAYIEKAVAHELAMIRVAEGRYAEAEQIMDEYVWLGAPIFKDFEGYKGAAGEWMLDYVDILEKVGKLDKARSGARAAKISLEKGYGPDAPLSRRASETFARLGGF